MENIETIRIFRYGRRGVFPSCASTLHGNNVETRTTPTPPDADVERIKERHLVGSPENMSDGSTHNWTEWTAYQAIVPGFELLASHAARLIEIEICIYPRMQVPQIINFTVSSYKKKLHTNIFNNLTL